MSEKKHLDTKVLIVGSGAAGLSELEPGEGVDFAVGVDIQFKQDRCLRQRRLDQDVFVFLRYVLVFLR